MTKKINSNQKGKTGEREWRDELRSYGYESARRGRQYSGSPESPDVVCVELPFHWEIKRVERLNISKAMEQAKNDAGDDQIPIVAHRKNNEDWKITMFACHFFKGVGGGFIENDKTPEVLETNETLVKGVKRNIP